MEERRKQVRYPIALLANFALDEKEKGICALVDMSPEGSRVKFHAEKPWPVDSTVPLQVRYPPREPPMPAAFKVKWVKRLEGEKPFNYIAGGHLGIQEPGDRELVERYIRMLYQTVRRQEEDE